MLGKKQYKFIGELATVRLEELVVLVEPLLAEKKVIDEAYRSNYEKWLAASDAISSKYEEEVYILKSAPIGFFGGARRDQEIVFLQEKTKKERAALSFDETQWYEEGNDDKVRSLDAMQAEISIIKALQADLESVKHVLRLYDQKDMASRKQGLLARNPFISLPYSE